MLISDIHVMEEIVANNENLHWDGWNVVHVVEDDSAQYDNAGYYNRDNAKWYRKKSYSPDGIGWDIPDAVIS
jgi:hypothetical protein